MAERFAGKVALVTGGTSGIGAAIVRGLVRDGAKVVISGIQDAEGRALQDELGANTLFVHHDVSSEQSWRDLTASLRGAMPQLDIVVNNAGVSPMGDIESMSLEQFNGVFAINVGGVFLGCKYGIEMMKHNEGGGAIVNIASTTALKCPPWVTAYGASKAAVVHLTRTVALHCANHRYRIRCNAVLPGAVLTPMVNAVVDASPDPEAAMQGLIAAHPIGRLGETSEIADTVLFLASDASSYVTGALLPVDGGATAG